MLGVGKFPSISATVEDGEREKRSQWHATRKHSRLGEFVRNEKYFKADVFRKSSEQPPHVYTSFIVWRMAYRRTGKGESRINTY